MLQEAYVSRLIDLLEKYPVKRKVYLTLQKIYSGSGAESAKVLIRYLEQKNKKETPNVWGAAAFAAIGIGQLQGICGEEWKSSFSTMLMLIVVILGLGILYALSLIHIWKGMIIRGPADSIPDLTTDAGKHKKRNSGSVCTTGEGISPGRTSEGI